MTGLPVTSLKTVPLSYGFVYEIHKGRVRCYNVSMKVRHVDHVGINVEDLEAAKTFFTDLGFTVIGEMEMKGELLDKVTGLKNAKDDLVMLQAPDGQLNLELVQYHHPLDEAGVQISKANTLGLRHLCLNVEGLDSIVATLQQKGHQLMGEVQTYENAWKLCYIRGPEGIIIELAEQL
jgi:catechol 2,3-dioxygenase-like lactoylglutathione lyase family enzyme